MSSSVAERLGRQTSSLVQRFTSRVSDLKGHSEFASLVRGLDAKSAVAEALRFFPEGVHSAVGIDGSMDYDERLEMLLFYVCATAFRCPLLVGKDGVRLELKEAERDSRRSVSAAVPLWLEDLSEVSRTLRTAETDFDFERSLERIPYALMTLAELSIGLDSVENKDVKVVFLDRPLYATFGPASRDLRLLLSTGETSLTSFATPKGQLSMLDLSLATVLGPGDLYVPKRPPYLVYAAIQTILNHDGEIAKAELAKELGIGDNHVEKIISRLNVLSKKYGGELIEKTSAASIFLKNSAKDYWVRVSAVAKEASKRVFQSVEHPLQLGDDKWLTVLDLGAVNAFLIYELMHQAKLRKVLVVGITKDTGASEFTRSVLPLSTHSGLLKLSKPLPNLKNDRAFLTIMAAANSDLVKTPWRTISYDACFTTLVENSDPDTVLKAARKLVSRERVFVKAYFQLRSFTTDPATRSPVFAYDRFYNTTIDQTYSDQVDVLQMGIKTKINPCFEGAPTNPLDNVILHILSMGDNPEVLEALGHSQLLYLADKAVKAEVKAMRAMLRGVADLELGTLARKERIFSLSRRYRDFRAESEAARSRAAHREVFQS
ncbi:MAG: hypothetical protein HYU39_00140 [Thaumarchaeota archaeon]|nr:hypothetical protein [Nitrososphaerota archaeon]